MRATNRWIAGAMACGLGGALLVGAPSQGVADTSATAPSPGYVNDLSGVSASSATNAWAVGSYINSAGKYKNLTQHWDGAQWTTVQGRNPGPYHYLHGVTTLSPTKAWAFGHYYNHSGPAQTLIEHWDGSSWTLDASPSPGSGSYIYGLDATSATNAWAVGHFYDPEGNNHTLAEHWNGTSWTTVPSPSPSWTSASPESRLLAVTAVSAGDVWAVGYYNSVTGRDRTLIEHWDGTRWAKVPSPNPGPGPFGNHLNSVTAISADDVWAVGYTYDRDNRLLTLTEHWDGTRWSVVPSPNPDWPHPSGSLLSGVSASSSDDVWAVGYYYKDEELALIEHWDGTRWSVVPTPRPRPWQEAYLGSVSSVSGSDAWAVGLYYSRAINENRALIEHWDGTRWTRS